MKENYLEIDLFDLVKEIFKKWKVVLIFVLVFAILGGLYGFYQIKRPAKSNEEMAGSLKAVLTSDEINDVENSAKVINSYRSAYNKQYLYNEKSIYQNLDPYSIDVLRLSYYVDNHYKVSYPTIEETNNTSSIIKAYESVFEDKSLFTDIAKQYNVEPAYIQELITCGEKAEEKEDKKETESPILIIEIYGADEGMLVDIGEFVKEAVSERLSAVTEIYGDHDITLVSETIGKKVDLKMAETQGENIKKLTDIATSISIEEKLYSGDKLIYLHFLIHDNPEEDVSIVKNSVIGAALGMVFGAIYCAIKYFASGTVKTEDEINSILKTLNLGDASNIDYSVCEINKVMESSDCRDMVMVSYDEDSSISKIAEVLKCKVLVAKDLLNDSKVYEEFANCDSVILAEKLKVSKRKDVLAEKSVCQSANVKILGVIIK